MSHTEEKKRVLVPGVQRERIKFAEGISGTADKLALNLLTVLFTNEELRRGNCTTHKRADLIVLRLNAIRCKFQYWCLYNIVFTMHVYIAFWSTKVQNACS